MKVLFVSSGNSALGISPIVKNQGESLVNEGCIVNYFTIKGKGIGGYLKNVHILRQRIKLEKPDIIHAHYSFSGFTASLAGAKPLLVSLMGSDIKANSFFKIVIRFFAFFSWASTIVKSEEMKESLKMKNAIAIPNGVNCALFRPMHKNICMKQLNWNEKKRHILFAAPPHRPEKNFELTKQAFALLNDKDIVLHYLGNVPNEDMPIYYNSADLVMLTSLREGSPNVIKEAMACNSTILATDVGDIKSLFGDVEGCYICKSKPKEVARLMLKALNTKVEMKSRDRIKELKIDSTSVAKQLLEVYNNTLK